MYHELYSLLSFPQKRFLELVLYKVEAVGAKASDNVESNRYNEYNDNEDNNKEDNNNADNNNQHYDNENNGD